MTDFWNCFVLFLFFLVLLSFSSNVYTGVSDFYIRCITSFVWQVRPKSGVDFASELAARIGASVPKPPPRPADSEEEEDGEEWEEEEAKPPSELPPHPPPPHCLHTTHPLNSCCRVTFWAQSFVYAWAVLACHTPWQPFQNYPSRTLDAVVGRRNAERTVSKSGHLCRYLNCSWWLPAEKTGRRSWLNRPSCSPVMN